MREMKNSGVPWIGVIPASWRIGRVKEGFIRKKQEAHQDNPVILSLARAGVRVRDMSNNEGQIAESYFNYNVVSTGDLLLNPMDLYSGANCSVSRVEGVISPAYVNLGARKGYDSTYYDYYFKTQYWAMALFAHGKGVSFDNRWTLSNIDLMRYFIPVPPEKEQHRIADFLDSECARIDSIIDQTRASIEEYKKLKQSVITQAVTKGIRSDCELKDSGYVWIGEIPVEWNVVSVGRLFSISAGGDAKPEFYSTTQDEDHPFPVYTNSMNKNQVYAYTSNPVFPKDTITVTGRGAIGTAFYRDEPYDAIIRLLSLKPKLDLDGRFYAYWISNVIHFFTDSAAVGQLSSIQMASYKTVYCSKDEQVQIADYLDAECEKIDLLISKKDNLLIEIEAYKRALIYEYITGKKEVPNADHSS